MECRHTETISLDGISRWVEVAIYERVGITARDAIGAYIESPHFGKSYLAAEEAGGGDIHGPFPVRMIAPDDYVPSTLSDFNNRLHWFCYEYPENPKYRVLSITVTKKLHMLQQTIGWDLEDVFRLGKDERDKDPGIGWILLVFHEYLFLRRNDLISVIIGED